jgi:hypothetical protein
MEHKLHDCGDENAKLPAENDVKSKFSLAPVIIRHVEVDWRRREWVDVSAVASFISDLRPNERTLQLAVQLYLCDSFSYA